MMKSMQWAFCLNLIFGMTYLSFSQTLPSVSCGKMVRMSDFPSSFVTKRTIDIWLPPTYDETTTFDVLYMHDGQMLFDSGLTWNKQAWEVDQTLCALGYNVIVVGIWNVGSERHMDYFPQQPFEEMRVQDQEIISAQLKDAGRANGQFTPHSDNYLKFIVNELKPYIDSTFRVDTSREHTFIAGSSMGGLISLYALCEYPDVFGGAACLSTHWPGTFTVENNPFPEAMRNYLKKHLPSPKNHKIYFDYGDQTLDALYPPLQEMVDRVMKKRHYKQGKSWITKFFPGDDHSERSWAKRLNVPFNFFFLKEFDVLISK
jgi:predicted alpha/beta superfamily hydrolase